jgi:myo-inositol-1(or 4)-monophosphatase
MNDVEVARSAAIAGSHIVRQRFGRTTTRIEKGHAFEFATDADLDAERAIVETLRRERPSDAVLGEESGRTGGEGNRLWLVDPLCGTTNFAAGVPLVAVNVGLAVAGRPIVGAVVDPFHDELFWTDGTAAGMLRNDEPRPLVPSGDSRAVDFNLEPPYPSAPGFSALAMMGDPAFTRTFQPRVTSTSLTLTWVAMGRRAAYVTDGHLADHMHFAAGIAICRAAGCTVTDLRGGPLPPDGNGHGLLAAADESTHAALLAIVRRLAGDRLAT